MRAGALASKSVPLFVYPLTTVAGLLTSLSPCVLSILPLTIGYIGGYSKTAVEGSEALSKNAAGFALGIASSFAALGVFSTTLGKTYGQTGPVLPCLASLLAVSMGLNLLEVVQFQFPSAFQNFDPRNLEHASPRNALGIHGVDGRQSHQRGVLLLFYAMGYVTPLLVAASATENLKQIPSIRAYSQWINPVSGTLLVAGGTYFFLDSIGSIGA